MNITVVINGHPLAMEFVASAPAKHVIERALHETANVVPIPAEWELRDERGFLFDAQKPLADRASDGDTLYLNPMAGVGG